MTDIANLTLQQAREMHKQKADELHKIFEEAGPELDMGKVTTIEGDSKAKATEIKKRNDELGDIGKRIEELNELDGARKAADDARGQHKATVEPPMPFGKGEDRKEIKSVGELFVESKQFQERARGAEMEPVTIDLEKEYGKGMAAAGLKTVFDTGTSWVLQNVRLPSPITPPNRPLAVADMMSQGRTSGNAITYMEETTTTSNAAEVAESGTKPEAALVFTEKTSAVRKIAVTLPVTEESLDDVPFIESYINNRLGEFVKLREDSQLLVGNGTPPNLRGLLNISGIQTQAKGADPTPDAIYKAMVLAQLAFFQPDGFIVHPTDWQDVKLLRTADGIYIWGSPADMGPDRIWGLQVTVTPAITQNTGLVGAFKMGATVFRRSDVSLRVGYINDQFTKNQVTLLAEERLALVAFRPTAFVTVTGI